MGGILNNSNSKMVCEVIDMADWNKIKTEYITTDIGQRKLAEKYNVAVSTINHRSKAENWYEQKLQYTNDVVTEAVNKSKIEEAAFLAKELEFANELVKLLSKTIEDETFDAHTSFGEAIENTKDTKKILEAANAMEKLVRMKRTITGSRNKREQEEYALQVRKLDIEEKRATKDDIEDREIELILPDEAKEWTV